MGNVPINAVGGIPLWSLFMSVQAELLNEIEIFLAKRGGMAETTFGRLAVNDGKFVRRLREGCNMTLATIDRTRKFIRNQSPASEVSPSTKGQLSEAPVAVPPKPKAKRQVSASSPPLPAEKAA